MTGSSSTGNSPATHRETVDAAWVDYNGHMNVAFYVLVFDHATDAFLDALDLGENYRTRARCSVFVGEMHVCYLQEVVAGDELAVTTRLLASDRKRLVLFHEMRCARIEGVVASNEVLCVHVDLDARRAVAWPDTVAARLAATVAGDAGRPRPDRSGRAVALRTNNG